MRYVAMWEEPRRVESVGSITFEAQNDAEGLENALLKASEARRAFAAEKGVSKLRPAWFKLRLVMRESDGVIIYRP